MKQYLILLIIPVIVCTFSCNKDDDCDTKSCGELAIIDADLYENGPNDSFILNTAAISDDCLVISVQYGGGCGTVDFQLIDEGVILESFPVQRNIRIALKDDDLCEALLSDTQLFDISSLQVKDYDKLYFNLVGWDYQLLYEYK